MVVRAVTETYVRDRQRLVEELLRVVNRDGSFHVETIDRARFVPLIGEHGW